MGSCSSTQASNTGTMLESGIYSGTVFHQRSIPKLHRFNYKIYLFWLKLNELDIVEHQVAGFTQHKSGLSIVNYTRSDYLGDPSIPLQEAVLAKMNELNTPKANDDKLTGDVFLLGQVRTFGLYFSPVNFYYLRGENGYFSHMLAEVSNTPWNKRHHYLVDLAKQMDSEKAFHVSPFNPMQMQYKWQIQQPNETLQLHLSCYQEQKHFEAAINMHKQPLTTATLRASLLSIPSMTLKTILGIYWQATKLFFKRVPIYTHS